MAQFARPSADTARGTYTDQADGTTNIYATLADTSANDATYIKSTVAPAGEIYVTKLSNIEDPLSATGHVVRVRHQKEAAGGATITLTVQLRQGYVSEGSPGTLIATPVNAVAITETATTTTHNLSGPEADAITDYESLFLRFVATQS